MTAAAAPEPGRSGGADQESRIRFERYLTGVATRFLNLPIEEVDGELAAALEGLLDVLDVDRCGIGLPSGTEGLLLLHTAVRPGVPPVPPGLDLSSVLPWFARQMREGRRLVLPRLPECLPPEASIEAAYTRQAGLKSHVALPMISGVEIVGGLAIATFREYRDWDDDIVSRLDLLASVFASALYRRVADARVQAAEELNRSILASIPQALLVVDGAGRVLADNDAWAHGAARGDFPPVAIGDTVQTLLDWASARGCSEDSAIPGFAAVVSGKNPRFEGLCRHPGVPAPRVYSVTATPLQGEGAGAVVVHTDVTELEETKAALEASLREVTELKERLEAENVALREEVRHARGLRRGRGHEPRALARPRPGRAGRPHRCARAPAGRDRHRQGARGACAPRPLPPPRAAVRHRQLRGPARDPRRERAVRLRERAPSPAPSQRTLGRFEAAHGGTLFLDEIGELPLEVQAKLLRVLQTGEFERLGVGEDASRSTCGSSRPPTATSSARCARAASATDLFYRLSVFPIALPPLRERREDVPLLVWHFIGRRQAALGRSVKRVPDRLMRAFTAYDWPGNVRELENVVERSLIMTSGATLATDPAFFAAAPVVAAVGPKASLAEAHRAHIRAVLEECGWRISGKGNAADRLGLKRTTLQFRMKKLGIARPGS